MNDFLFSLGLTLMIIAGGFSCRACGTMDAEHCITVCNARVESYNDLTTQCECRR
jgi:hypothetical protein